jgi:colicin import membrane protein
MSESKDIALPILEIQKFDTNDEKLIALSNQYIGLKINGLDDKEGYKAVCEARQIVKKQRIAIEKSREDFKQVFIQAGKQIDTQAKHLQSLIAPVETHLAKEEKAIDDEKERIKQEKERVAQERFQKRIDLLSEYRHPIHMGMIAAISDDEFEALLEKAKLNHELELSLAAEASRHLKEALEEKEKKDKEEDDARRAEAEKLAQEQRELQDERNRLSAERKAIEDEKEALAAAERGRIAIENARKRDQELKEQARRDAEAELARKEQEKIAAEKSAMLEKERLEALKPDKEKMLDLIDELEKRKMPEFKHVDAIQIFEGFKGLYEKSYEFLRESCEKI